MLPSLAQQIEAAAKNQAAIAAELAAHRAKMRARDNRKRQKRAVCATAQVYQFLQARKGTQYNAAQVREGTGLRNVSISKTLYALAENGRVQQAGPKGSRVYWVA